MQHKSKKAKLIIALFPFALVIFLYIWLKNYYSAIITSLTAPAIDLEKSKKVVEILQGSFTTLAIIAGGVWAYYKFFKGRTYRPRLERKISGKLISQNNVNYLMTIVQLKNIGLSDVRIKRESLLQIFAYLSAEKDVRSFARQSDTKELCLLPVFQKHDWIEPGELIEDYKLITLPDDVFVSLRLELRLLADKIEWNDDAVIEFPAEPQAESVSIEVRGLSG